MSRSWPTEDDSFDKKSFKGGASLLKSDLVKRKREKSTLEAIDAPKTKKNKPQEMPSNRPVPRLNASSISGITIKKTGFDPRFEGDATAEDQQLFRSAYRFIDDIKSGEIETMNKSLKKEKDFDKRKQIQADMNKLRSDLEKKKRLEGQDKMFTEYKRKERELVAQGKTPFYLKKSSVKELGAASDFLALDKAGKVDKFITKKRTKAAQKDRKYMPSGE